LKHKQEDIKQMHCVVAILRKLMLLSIHEFTDLGETQIVCAIFLLFICKCAYFI
jgi:hypothetical protein